MVFIGANHVGKPMPENLPHHGDLTVTDSDG